MAETSKPVDRSGVVSVAGGATAEDLAVLHNMGYAQELDRRMSVFSNFAISFSIICIMSGGINSLAQATSGAGGAAIGIGWPVGCLISATFAFGMAQIASSFPTAGGLYHWGSILGNRFTGWLTAWFNLLGLITVLGSVNVGSYTFFISAFGPSLGIENSFGVELAYLVAATGLMATINHFGIGLTAKLTDFSGYLIFTTAIILTTSCLLAAPSYDLSRLFTFENYSGASGGGVWPPVSGLWVFLLGLLLPIYTMTGYDASAHTAEETINAAVAVPRGIMTAVFWSSLVGYLMLCSFILMLPNMSDAAKQGWNVFFWAMDAQMNPAAKFVIYGAIWVSQLLCGLATVTSTSRMIFAFARDRGLPASKLLSKVSTKHRTPVAAIWSAAIFSVMFVVGASAITIAGTSAYSIVVSCTVIFLFFSFTIPVAAGLMAYGTKKWSKPGPWNMGRGLFSVAAILSLLAMALIFLIGVQPPNDWALEITIGFVALTSIIWLGFESRRFKGPPIGDAIATRADMIATAESALERGDNR